MMTFYTLNYLTAHQQINQLFNYIIIIILALLIAGTAIMYFRDEQWVLKQIHAAGYKGVEDIYLGEYIDGQLTLIPCPEG